MTTTIMVTHRQVGFHYWPDAPPERGYLAHKHRHLFMIIVCCPVQHDDRFIEFHDLQDKVRAQYKEVHDFGAKSCERIARDLGHALRLQGMPPIWVEVWEDEENGARVEFGS